MFEESYLLYYLYAYHIIKRETLANRYQTRLNYNVAPWSLSKQCTDDW